MGWRDSVFYLKLALKTLAVVKAALGLIRVPF
jgi:hypothetical protein